MLIAKCGGSALGDEEKINEDCFVPSGALTVSSVNQKLLCHLEVIFILRCGLFVERSQWLLMGSLLNKKKIILS